MASFFESLESSQDYNSLWGPAPPTLQGKVIHSGPLMKHSKKGHETTIVERYFCLQGSYLMYKNSQSSSKISAVMNIKYAKLSLPDLEDIEEQNPNFKVDSFALKLSKGSKYSLLFARNKAEFEQWVAALTKLVVRTDIHSRFSVERQIGSGAFAQVFQAKEKSTGVDFAVKGFNKTSVLQNPNGKASLWKEIEILRSISGKKNIITLHEVHETKNSIYLIMDLVEGRDLLSLIRNSEITLDMIREIAYGILAGLEALSQDNIFHRDIKPANIMLRKTRDVTVNDVVIVDFGLAASSQDTKFIFKRCGTPGYIAPELISLKNVEKNFSIPLKSDVYSVGVVLYYLCTKEPLFDKSDFDCKMVLKANLQSRVVFPKEKFDSLGPQIVDLLVNLLQPSPEKRYTIRQALNHPLFNLFKEESLDSSIEENDCEESPKITPVVSPSMSILMRNRFIPWASKDNFEKLGGSIGGSFGSESGPKSRILIAPSQFQITPRKMNTKETAIPHSPVTSQSNGISRPNSKTNNCLGFTRLMTEHDKALEKSLGLEHEVVDDQIRQNLTCTEAPKDSL